MELRHTHRERDRISEVFTLVLTSYFSLMHNGVRPNRGFDLLRTSCPIVCMGVVLMIVMVVPEEMHQIAKGVSVGVGWWYLFSLFFFMTLLLGVEVLVLLFVVGNNLMAHSNCEDQNKED